MWTVYYMIVVIEFNFKMNYLTVTHPISFIFPVDLTEYFSVLLSTYPRDIYLIIMSSPHCTKKSALLCAAFQICLWTECIVLHSSFEPLPEAMN